MKWNEIYPSINGFGYELFLFIYFIFIIIWIIDAYDWIESPAPPKIEQISVEINIYWNKNEGVAVWIKKERKIVIINYYAINLMVLSGFYWYIMFMEKRKKEK